MPRFAQDRCLANKRPERHRYLNKLTVTYPHCRSLKPACAPWSRLSRNVNMQYTIRLKAFVFFPPWHNPPPTNGPGPSHYRGFTFTLRHTTLDRTLLDEWSARRSELCLKTHSGHKSQTFMPLEGFEPADLASKRPQTHHTLEHAAIGISNAVVLAKTISRRKGVSRAA